MTDADDVYDSQAATLRAVSREPSSLHHQRRSSTNEHINDILEVGRTLSLSPSMGSEYYCRGYDRMEDSIECGC